MSDRLVRPVPTYDPSKRLLHNDHFQIGYVTNDIDRAVEIFRDRFGVAEFRANDHALPNGSSIRVRSAWVGKMMYEICHGTGPGMEIYTDFAAPDAPFVLQLHHFGYLIPDEETWSALEAELVRHGRKVRSRSDMPGFFKGCHVEAPELGYFLEYTMPRAGLYDRLNATPGL